MPSAFDAFVKHQIGLQRLGAALAAKVNAHLVRAQNEASDRAQRQLARILERGGATPERLQGLRQSIAEALKQGHQAIRAELASELLALAKYEAEWLARFYNEGVGLHGQIEVPPAAALRAVVNARPFMGALLRDWAGQMEKNQLTRIDQLIRLGVSQGEGIDAILRRLRGSSALNYRDGQFARDRHGAETLVLTAVNHVAVQAHEALIEPHEADFPKYRWVAGLDNKSTKLCGARDGETFRTGDGPAPPAHWRCRSSILFVPRGQAGIWDAVPTYQAWLKGQDAETQDDILGKKAGRLYRSGGLPVKSFVARSGATLTLIELERKESAAWAKAFGA